MLVGCPKEIKNNEYRVGLTPSTVRSLISQKHSVIIEKSAGIGSGFSDIGYGSLTISGSFFSETIPSISISKIVLLIFDLSCVVYSVNHIPPLQYLQEHYTLAHVQ